MTLKLLKCEHLNVVLTLCLVYFILNMFILQKHFKCSFTIVFRITTIIIDSKVGAATPLHKGQPGPEGRKIYLKRI